LNSFLVVGVQTNYCLTNSFKPINVVLATTGPSEKNADYVLSVLCLSCETLMIVTTQPGAVIGIHHSAGNQVTVRGSEK